MKLNLKNLGLIALSAITFMSCSEEEPTPPPSHFVSDGAFIVNAGNYGAKIDGSLTHIDYESEQSAQNVFQTQNGRSLGATPQDAVIANNMMFVAVYESNVVEVINRDTFKSVKQIRFDGNGTQPRDIITNDAQTKVYVSLFDGYVAEIDTKTLTVDKKVKVGPNPEEIAIAGNYLYVTNSDGMNLENGNVNGKSVSKVDLSTFTEVKKIPVVVNPMKIVANGSNVYVISMGNYYDIPAVVQQIDPNDNVTSIANATLMATYGNELYLIDAPFGNPTPRYFKYNVVSKTITENMVINGVDSPCAIAVEPTSGSIFISSYNITNGYADYLTAGYVNIYSPDGTSVIKKYETGVGPCGILFDVVVEK